MVLCSEGMNCRIRLLDLNMISWLHVLKTDISRGRMFMQCYPVENHLQQSTSAITL